MDEDYLPERSTPLAYFGWWTKAGVAAGVGLGMIVLAQALPGQETFVLFGGLGVFALASFFVLYAGQA